MAENPDTTAVNVESSSENPNQQENQIDEQDQNDERRNNGGRRGGGGGRFAGGGFVRRKPFGQQGFQPRQQQHQQEQLDFKGKKRLFRGPGGEGGMGGMGPRNPDDRLMERVAQLSGPTYELPVFDTSERKFSGRARLYIGNVAPDIVDEEVNELFGKFGETSELFINREKNFGFIKLDYHANAEKAKRELDGTVLKGRNMKIRFAPIGATLKVKNLGPFVSNELLHVAFGVFGEIERCSITVDERGRPTGEGIVEFVRKNSAGLAIKKCAENCYFLTSSLRPVIVEQHEVIEDTDGFPDKTIPKKHPQYASERDVGPRFANKNSFQFEYGTRWKQLHELYNQKEDALKKEFEMEKEKLVAQMEFTRYEHETEMLREQLRAREMDRDRQKREWEMKERQAEESKQRSEEQMRRQQEEMQARMLRRDEELHRRQQESNLFMQAHQLDNILEQEEQQTYDQPATHGLFSADAPEGTLGVAVEPKAFLTSNSRFNDRPMGHPGQKPGNFGARGGRWVNENREGPAHGNFAAKRRRF